MGGCNFLQGEQIEKKGFSFQNFKLLGSTFWFAIFINFIDCAWFSFHNIASQFFQDRFQIGKEMAGFFISIPMFSSIIGVIFLGRVVDRFRKIPFFSKTKLN